MVAVLKPLQVATTALCEEKNISVSLVYPVINGLVRKHLVVKEEDLMVVKNLHTNSPKGSISSISIIHVLHVHPRQLLLLS